MILQTLSSTFLEKSTVRFRAEMTRLGFKDGTDVSYTVLNAKGDYGRAKSLLTSAIDENTPDLVVTVATLATRAGRDLLSGTKIPQMFLIVTDPVGEGFVSEMGKTSGANITGQSHVVPVESQLALVSQILQTARRDTPFRIGILRSTYPSAVSESAQLRAAAHQFPIVSLTDLGFPYLPGDSGRPEMNKSAVELITAHKDSLDGIWLVAGPNQTNLDFVNTVLATGMPIVNSGNIRNARLGAMLALQSTVELNGRAAAEAASAILSGTNPADIPVTRPSKFIAGVNVLTAARLGAVIPSGILELAQENVFYRQGRGN
ncbi:ABC transporter substrate binding protein [Nisaea nitritireducens]|uniref:ABC transporter substrate binding protein n=1 Tax=Nisaea nitritireducens TaxID=568392 RepID=UPI0018688E84|nr:ABC transporter substrate binding protein [Nisaea nitritireducens]